MKKVKREVQVCTVYEWSSLEQHTESYGTWIDGTLRTKQGLVKVYSEVNADSRFKEFSSYDLIWNGRDYNLREERFRTKRGLAIMGKRFAREVATGKHD